MLCFVWVWECVSLSESTNCGGLYSSGGFRAHVTRLRAHGGVSAEANQTMYLHSWSGQSGHTPWKTYEGEFRPVQTKKILFIYFTARNKLLYIPPGSVLVPAWIPKVYFSFYFMRML